MANVRRVKEVKTYATDVMGFTKLPATTSKSMSADGVESEATLDGCVE